MPSLPVSVLELLTTLLMIHTNLAPHYNTTVVVYITTFGQGRSCKQICWPPGVGGLQRVGLDPGQYDHHPHGVVHVGQLQDV